jgi:hypothetical protein
LPEELKAIFERMKKNLNWKKVPLRGIGDIWKSELQS